jgi:flavin reductase (DIM6/NTAB) family NADH-FMN oxidoreductase RutF
MSTEPKTWKLLEQDDPANNLRGFRHALGHFATGVTVITTWDGTQIGAVTANSFSSVSLDPPLVLWSIAESSKSYDLFSQSGRFVVNVLRSDQLGIAQRFARSGPEKLEGFAWAEEGIEGYPIIPGALAVFEASVHARYRTGDHLIMIGRVDRFSTYEGDPILFSGGRFGLLSQLLPQDRQVERPAREPLPYDYFLGLSREVTDRLSRGIQQHREAEGLTMNEGWTLSALTLKEKSDLHDVARIAYLQPDEAKDTVAALVAAGLAEVDLQGLVSMTPEGRARLTSLRERISRFEQDKLSAIAPADLEVTRRTLATLAGYSAE